MIDPRRAMNRKLHVRGWLRYAAIVAVVSTLTSLTACTESPSSKAIRAAQQYMRARTIQPGIENGLYRSVTWNAGDRVVGELDEERFPDWARGTFIACVHWEESFSRVSTDAATGDSRTQQGHAEGWILIGEGLYSYILELTVDFDGHHFDWIRAWNPDA